jgi:hypothetical protein
VLEHLWSSHRGIAGGTADKDDQQQPQDLDAEVALAARAFLAAVLAALPSWSVVFTVGLAILAALGVGSCEAACGVRTSARSASILCCQGPSRRHCAKYS